MYQYSLKYFKQVKKIFWIILGFRQTSHLPLPQVNIITYFSLRAKCWVTGGVGRRIPQNLNWSNPFTPSACYGHIVDITLTQKGKRGLRKGERLAFPSGWPGFESRMWRHMWLEFLLVFVHAEQGSIFRLFCEMITSSSSSKCNARTHVYEFSGAR